MEQQAKNGVKNCYNWNRSASIKLLQVVAPCFKIGWYQMASKDATLQQPATN